MVKPPAVVAKSQERWIRTRHPTREAAGGKPRREEDCQALSVDSLAARATKRAALLLGESSCSPVSCTARFAHALMWSLRGGGDHHAPCTVCIMLRCARVASCTVTTSAPRRHHDTLRTITTTTNSSTAATSKRITLACIRRQILARQARPRKSNAVQTSKHRIERWDCQGSQALQRRYVSGLRAATCYSRCERARVGNSWQHTSQSRRSCAHAGSHSTLAARAGHERVTLMIRPERLKDPGVCVSARIDLDTTRWRDRFAVLGRA